jgi:DUF917 family protein
MTGEQLGSADLERLLWGASVLGTGGGGSFSRGRAILQSLAQRDRLPRLIAIDDLPAEGLGVSTAMLGGGLTNAAVEALEAMAPEPPCLPGAQALSAFFGRPITFVFAAELGPQNTLEAARLAALLDVPLVDGDCAGRAVPELHQTTLSVQGIPLTPFVLATFQGDVSVISKIADDARGEALCRAIASASGGLVALTGFPMDPSQARRALIPGTIRRCMALGGALGEGRFSAETFAQTSGGRLAFHGRVAQCDVRLQGGFFRGRLDLEGLDAFAGSRYHVGIQNEFMWSWNEDQLDIACPDLVCVVDSRSGIGKVTYGHGFENALEVGETLTVFHLPCAPPWQTEAGRRRFPAPPSTWAEL